MTAVLRRPPDRTATRALARTEAMLLLRGPTLWAGVAVTAGLCVTWLWSAEPVGASLRTDIGLAAMVLAGVLIVLGHLAASRDHRHGAREAVSTLPVRPARRTVALLVLVPVGGLAGALCLGLELLTLAPAWPGGTFRVGSALVAVLVPMAGAAIGVAAGTWLPSAAACALTLFTAAAGIAALPVFGSGAGSLPWRLFPVEVVGTPAPPAGWHLLYLLAVLLAVVSVALLRHSRRRPALVVAVILAVALAVVAVRRDTRSPMIGALPVIAERGASPCP